MNFGKVIVRNTLLHPAHRLVEAGDERGRYYLRCCRQVYHGMPDHDGQRVALAVVVPAQDKRQRQERDEPVQDITGVEQCRDEAVLQRIKERRDDDGGMLVFDLIHSATEIEPIFRKNGGDGQQHDIDDGQHFRDGRNHHGRRIQEISVAQESRQIHSCHADDQHQQRDANNLLPSGSPLLIVYQLPIGSAVALGQKYEQQDSQDVQHHGND